MFENCIYSDHLVVVFENICVRLDLQILPLNWGFTSIQLNTSIKCSINGTQQPPLALCHTWCHAVTAAPTLPPPPSPTLPPTCSQNYLLAHITAPHSTLPTHSHHPLTSPTHLCHHMLATTGVNVTARLHKYSAVFGSAFGITMHQFCILVLLMFENSTQNLQPNGLLIDPESCEKSNACE